MSSFWVGFRSGLQPAFRILARFMLACDMVGFPPRMSAEDRSFWIEVERRGWR